MAQNLNKNTFSTVYKDDFVDSNNYYRILFNSGKKLQARELTQAQTIIQKQIQRFGSNIFKDNAIIKGGQSDIDNAYEYIKLNTATYTGPADPQTLVGYTFTGKTSLVQFKVVEVVDAIGADPLTLYGTYVSTKNSSASTTSTIRMQANELLENPSFDDLQVENTATCVGVGSRFMAGDAIYYTKGFFVFTEAQSIILSKYTTNPTAEVGYRRSEQTVSADDYPALYDNQGSEPNVTAPGADRYKISLTLVNKSTLAVTDNYLPRATIRNGAIVTSTQIVNAYNVPNEVIATRIYENSGDYLVKPFQLSYGVDSADTHLNANLSDGIAVVQGYRTTQHVSKPSVRVSRSTNTITYEDQLVAAPYANYFEADSVSGLASDLGTTTEWPQQTLKDGADFGGSSIGTCHIRHVQQGSSGKRNIYVYKLLLNAGSGLQNVKSIGSSDKRFVNVTAGPINNTGVINSLLFPLPLQRPSEILNADYTIQRQYEFTPAGSTKIINASGTELFADASQWLVTAEDPNAASVPPKYGDLDSAANASFGIALNATNDQATLTGLSTGCLTRLNYFVRKSNMTSKNKILTDVNEVRILEDDGSGFKFINLHKPDIYSIQSIEDPSDPNITYDQAFSLDNGQRDNYYDNGKLALIGTEVASMSTTGLRIKYKYFAHQPGNTFFSRNSYSGQVDYKDIPKHTFSNGVSISLANVLDFRPTVDSDGIFNYTNGAQLNELPKPNGIIDLNVSYFLPRIDRISIDKNGILRYDEGASSPNPVAPTKPDDAMHLFDIFLNPNTLDEKDLSITKIDHKRYTMDQINILEKRLGRLEELTTLSLLEAKADTLLVLDASGDIRLKSGFVVDNYKSHAFSAVTNPDYRASLDLASGMLFPKKWEGTIDLFYDSTANNPSGNPFKIMGGFIVPKFDREIYLENEYVSNQMLVNPFQVNSYVGTMELYPASDTWYETAYLGSPAVTQAASKFSTNNAHNWNSHEWNWTGKDIDELQTGDNTNATETTSGNTVTTSWNTVSQIETVEVYTGETLISAVTIQKMRSKKIRFRATGCRPNAKLFAFFDDVAVDDWVRNESFGSSDAYQNAFNSDPAYGTTYAGATEHPDGPSQLETDDDGVCEGSFFLPSGFIAFDCGTKKFEIRDVSGIGNQANALSLAVANYTAQGTLQTYQKNYTSTRIVHVEGAESTYTKQNNSGGDGGDGGDDDWPSSHGGDGGTTYTGGQCSGTGLTNVSLPSGGDGGSDGWVTSYTAGHSPTTWHDMGSSGTVGQGSYSHSTTSSTQAQAIKDINEAVLGPW